ncbi:unnamed protein product [Rotaria sp. Silwood2]|nr:unnamed protein product [Rotaria sp. Silwood2]
MNTINRFKERLAEQKSNATAREKSTSLVMNDDDGDDDDDDDELMFELISNDEQAVQEMLISIFCYWKVLTKRFIDYVALYLRAGCNFDVCTGIQDR